MDAHLQPIPPWLHCTAPEGNCLDFTSILFILQIDLTFIKWQLWLKSPDATLLLNVLYQFLYIISASLALEVERGGSLR